jgi:hypothetical protein
MAELAFATLKKLYMTRSTYLYAKARKNWAYSVRY